jgi:hypothetical protein
VHDRTPDTLSLPFRRDGEWPEQRSVDAISDHATSREDHVSYNPIVNCPDERYGDDCIVQQVSHKGKQILVRERVRIK